MSPRRTAGYDAVELNTSPQELEKSDTKSRFSDELADRADSLSYHSHAPFNAPPTYPPGLPQDGATGSGRHVQFPGGFGVDANPPTRPTEQFRAQHSQASSWDLLKRSVDEYDPRNAREQHLAFADGDLPKTRFVRFYNYLLNVSIVTRWTLFIVPVLALLWIPGILDFTAFPNANARDLLSPRLILFAHVHTAGWWTCLAVSMFLPSLIRMTLGVIAVGIRRYIDWLDALRRYVALSGWTVAIWIAWNPLIHARQDTGVSQGSKDIINTIGKLLFGFLICAAVLLFEKFSIQWIAGKFHERSYAGASPPPLPIPPTRFPLPSASLTLSSINTDPSPAERIADQKFAVRTLSLLYRHSRHTSGRPDGTRGGVQDKRASLNPRRFFKRALKGVRFAATTTTTALGNVASEIAGSSVLQPNSPQAMVQTALESANKTRLLAGRLFDSFHKPYADYLTVDDIAPFYTNIEDADAAFTIFDKDGNGDISREEMEMACLEFHREQLSIENSMRDLDSAVGRLDNILMSVYVVVAVLILAVCLEAQLASLITGAGTLILGLSWLIGSSLAEVLTSIIFLFIKHPYDVGDKIDLGETGTFTVKEIRLLSTIFLDGHATLVQAPNTKLNDMFIQNIRRSPQMSEPFVFDVAYATSFEQIEALRENMLAFVRANRRDYQPAFDVTVVGTSPSLPSTSPFLIPYRRLPGPGEDDAQGGHHVQEQLAAGLDQSEAPQQVDLRTQDRPRGRGMGTGSTLASDPSSATSSAPPSSSTSISPASGSGSTSSISIGVAGPAELPGRSFSISRESPSYSRKCFVHEMGPKGPTEGTCSASTTAAAGASDVNMVDGTKHIEVS
ncbi:hypothetical protein EWM64_g4459 [Hericium alpestre]|uniref:EF-hand domain-containing protein n=1 Tax=Hericium alpestre TaxID=135208 RepID=A0A4Y9ZZS5_9AGAM|nr:hypothetical protein EWM64_g4459 [Hericium alpestre]